MITISIAGINIGIDNKYAYLEDMARDYITDKAAEFTVCATEGEIDAQMVQAPSSRLSRGYLESLSVYRHIAEKLPEYDAFLFHGCVIVHQHRAYVFTAKSGVGKTTHARNWLAEFGNEVHILNGDKPIIRIIDGVPYACGTPWQGKENYGVNEICEIKAFVFIERDKENKIVRIGESEALLKIMNQIYLPTKSAAALSATMKNADKILKSTSLFSLHCNPERESARVAFDELKRIN